jgi:hypothetical protein
MKSVYKNVRIAIHGRCQFLISVEDVDFLSGTGWGLAAPAYPIY